MKKVIVLGLLIGASQLWGMMGTQYDCPQNEKYAKNTKIEEIMYGDFKPRFIFELVKAMPSNKKIKVSLKHYLLLCNKALTNIDKRRSNIKSMVDHYDSNMILQHINDNYYANRFMRVWIFLCDYLKKKFNNVLSLMMTEENCIKTEEDYYYNIDAFNVLTGIKISLERSRMQIMNKIKECALVFKQQHIYLNSEMQNEDIPNEVVAQLVSYCISDKISASLKNIVLVLNWGEVDKFGEMRGNIYKVFRDLKHWSSMWHNNWIRCKAGKQRQPIYTAENFQSGLWIECYSQKFSPYFREVLTEWERINLPEGELWKGSYLITSDQQKTGKKEQIVWVKFPFEIGYDVTEKGCYNSIKKSRYQFKDGTIMDFKNNPYLDKKSGKQLKKLVPGKTAQDATWALASDAKQLYEDNRQYLRIYRNSRM